MQQIVQIPLDLGFRSAFGRMDFLVAPGNAAAVGWIDRWPDWPAPALVLFGPAACGKSHLAAVWAERSQARILTAPAFLEADVSALAMEAGTIVLDRADLLVGDAEEETRLFHLYNLMRERGGHLLLLMRSPPSELGFVLPDLASRLRSVPAVEIASPDDALLSAVLVKQFRDRQLVLGEDVLHYLLPRMERSFGAARDIAAAVDRLALAERKPVSVALVRRVLMDYPVIAESTGS